MSTLTWKTVVVILAILGGTAFLGHDHVLSGQTVGAIYSAVIASVLVGHYSAVGKGGE